MAKLFCLVALLLVVASVHADPVQVTIPNGPVVGETIALQPNVVVNRFLGIPYAKPPVGPLRFRKPQPADSWTEPLNALTYPKNCIQSFEHTKYNKPDFYFNREISEDCLYLNVWTPDVSSDEQHLRPVMVWIHGGGLILGSSGLMVYDSLLLAAKTDAVIVTINYRLSTLGFLYSDEVKEVSGNQGFYDQALALEWVKDNIRYFGGDPNAVTIFGESAGSWSVSAHLLSPVSRNLFQNAIMMSGGPNNIFITPEEFVKQTLPGIRKVGCATEGDTRISQRVVECLQSLDAAKLDEIYYLNNHLAFYRIAVVDGEFMPAFPHQMLKDGNHKKNFHLMVTTVEDEGSFMFYYKKSEDSKFDQEYPRPLSMEEAKEYLHQTVVGFTGDKSFNSDMTNRLYFNGFNEHYDSSDLLRKQVGVAFGDLFLTCPSTHFVRELYRSSPDSIHVYQAYFTFKLGQPKKLCSRWGGTCHSDELFYLFGHTFHQRKEHTNRERDISNEMTTFLSSFIRTGQPGMDHSEWQSYFMTDDGQHVIAPYYELSNHYKTHRSFGYNLKHAECEYLWSRYYR